MLSSLPFRHFLQIMLAATAMQSAMPGAFAQADPANEVGMANVGQMGQNALHTPPPLASLKNPPATLSIDDSGYQRLMQHIPPLQYDRAGRWPILVWAKETNTPDELQAWIDRGVSPLFNYQIEEHIDAWKQMQAQNVPVIFLMQGHTQRLFRENPKQKTNVNHSKHVSPAEGDCPAYLLTHPGLHGEGDRMLHLCQTLRDAGVNVDAVFLDFESGVYLRNGKESASHVHNAMTQALNCSRCIDQFGKEKLENIHAYRALCDTARSQAIRITASDPLHEVFPNADIGNFFAWPINRYINDDGVLDPTAYDTRNGAYPAYGYVDSGMNIMQPRCYYVPGWQDWGLPEIATSQRIEDWNVFLYTIRRTSLASRAMRPNEKLVLWVGWLWRVSRDHPTEGQLRIASPAGYRETIIHALLRGAETIAIFDPASLTQDFPDDYNVDRRNMGPFLRNLVDVQAAYNQVLRFQPFLTASRPLNLCCDGVPNHPGTMWSGYGNEKACLIRTISFNQNIERPITLYGHSITLPFQTDGRWFWVFPDGTHQQIEL